MSKNTSEKRPPFDVHLADEVRQFVEPLFLKMPELRGVSVCFDWHDDLNKAALHGLWLCDEGVVADPAGVLGGIMQTVKMLETQVVRARQLQQHLLSQVHTLAQEAARRHEEVQELDHQLARRREQAQAQETADQGAARQD